MFPLAEAAPQLRQQHLAHHVLSPTSCNQLIDAVPFQQLLGPLLLQRQAGVVEG